jgi:hypothetical protein
MILNISNLGTILIERGIYYFGLSNYPHMTALELKNMVAFIKYEELYGRQTKIVCEDEKILAIVNNAVAHPDTIENIFFPEGYEFVYHATSLKATKQILSGGKLLSAAIVYGKTGAELSYEKRNSPWNDPADFFEYIMFCWGDNVTGDYVVLSENFPSEEDLVKGNFNPGVRFYFRFDDIIRHPGHVFDGYHALKVKDEIKLSDYLHACIVPEQYKVKLENLILQELVSKVYYLSQNEIGLYDWNKKVYDFVSKL